jgi:uncharacterized protein (DUF1501 family)
MKRPTSIKLDHLTCEQLSRRGLLRTAGAFAATFTASSLLPVLPSLAQTRDPRFLLVILRGGLDGLSAVLPMADPDFFKVREGFLEDLAKGGEATKLDALFSLNPAMKTLASLYAQKQALFVQATATPYRERSHFDGQEILESGLASATHPDTGWLNRALQQMQVQAQAKDKVAVQRELGLGVGPMVPLVMRGKAPVLSWSPQHLNQAADDTVTRLMALYEARDPFLADALRRSAVTAKETKALDQSLVNRGAGGGAVLAMAEGAARFLSKPDGPRIGTLSIDGWDTHADERPGTGRLSQLLGTLDKLFEGLHTGLKPVWQDTVVAVVTEFGRTVRINGTAGTDHGTATTAFLLGGAVKGGRVIADWPGLSDAALHEGRDLKPTTDLRAILKGVLIEHLGIDAQAAGALVFPDSGLVTPTAGLTA